MRKLFLLALTVSLLICSCANTSEKNKSVTESSGDTSPSTTPVITTPQVTTLPETTEELPYEPDPAHPHAELFFDPPADYRWHSLKHALPNTYRVSVVEMQQAANKLKSQGEGGVVTNVPFADGYVDNPDHFNNLNGVAEVLSTYGLKLWLYDEQGYPSGTAGGRVTLNDTEHVAQGLTLIKKVGSGINPITVNKDERLMRLYTAYAIDESGNVHSATVTDNAVSFTGVSGNWTLYIYAIKEFYEGTWIERNVYHQSDVWLDKSYINIMDKDAVAKFIEIGYKPYVDNFYYMNQVVAVFTDEPALAESHNGASEPYDQLSWAPGFEELFEEMHGYSITHKLHHMFGGTSDEAKIVRANYRQTVAKMVAENYFKQINDFCVEHGTLLSGHMLGEEGITSHTLFYGDLMKCYREMGLPGVDILSVKGTSYFSTEWSEAMVVKTAASVSRITDKSNLTMVELCALDLENTTNFNSEEQTILWKVLNNIYFNGGNHINSYVDINGMGKNKKSFVNYFSRLGYFSQNAEWDGEIALYYPITTMQAYAMAAGSEEQAWPEHKDLSNKIAMKLWEDQLDFLRIDDRFLLEAEIKNGCLTNGYASFKAVILPNVEVMSLDSLKKLDEFKEAGGAVYFVDALPTLPDRFEDVEDFSALAGRFEKISFTSAMKDIKEKFSYALKLSRPSTAVSISKYKLDGDEAYWFLNDGSVARKYKLSYDGAKGFEVYDPLTGEIEYLDGSELTVNVNQYCALIITVKK